MLARLREIPGVADSRVERSGRRFLLALEPGTDERAVARQALEILGGDSRVLDGRAESEALASRRRGDVWVTSSESIRLSLEESGVIAAHFGEEAAEELGLPPEKTARLVDLVRKEVAAAFERFHGRSDALEAFMAEQEAISERVLAACQSFMTDAELQDLRAFGAAQAEGRDPSLCEPPVESPAPAASVLLPRDDLPGLPNFAQVSEKLYRGAQPTSEGMRELAKLGVKTVVNLRSFNSDRDELRGTGLRYGHIHCKTWHPETEDVVRFLSIVRNPENQPVFVHCQHGSDRTGMMVAAYRVVEQGWTPSQAAEELPRFGFHEIWDGIREHLSRMDSAALEESVARAPIEKLDVVR